MVSLSSCNITLVERMDLVMPPLKDMSQNNDELSPPPQNHCCLHDGSPACQYIIYHLIRSVSLSLSLSLSYYRGQVGEGELSKQESISQVALSIGGGRYHQWGRRESSIVFRQPCCHGCHIWVSKENYYCFQSNQNFLLLNLNIIEEVEIKNLHW